jgi:hypothetical protein
MVLYLYGCCGAHTFVSSFLLAITVQVGVAVFHFFMLALGHPFLLAMGRICKYVIGGQALPCVSSSKVTLGQLHDGVDRKWISIYLIRRLVGGLNVLADACKGMG